MAVEGVGVKRVHGLPQRVVDLAAHPRVELDAGLGDAAPLALGLLALLRGEGREERIEGLVAAG